HPAEGGADLRPPFPGVARSSCLSLRHARDGLTRSVAESNYLVMKPNYMNQTEPWELVPNALSGVECAEWIARATARGFEPMGNRYPGGYRNNDRLVLDDAEWA